MGDLQIDLNAALVAVKQKCVDLDEKVRREDEKPQNRGRGYLGVKRYIYALTTKNSEHSLNRRGRSLTRVYVEQKFYRSKSVPSPDQVQRLEDCTQDYGPNGEERLEFTETIEGPLEELIKEDQSHHQMVKNRLPRGHAEWDHELAVYEEDGVSGRIEDRTLTLRAGDHPFGMNQFNESQEISSKIAKFFGSSTEVDQIRTRELSLSVQPVYHQTFGAPYTSFGMTRSKSVGNVANRSKIDQTTTSLSDLYTVQTKHDYDSRYGHYTSGYGRYGQVAPPANPEVMPKLPKLPAKSESTLVGQTTQSTTREHIYDQPIVPPPRRSSLHYTPYESVFTYDRKYDFKSSFPPDVELPEGYHSYYDPSKFMFLDSQGYYQGNITRPLHYTYSRDYLEKYSDYQGTSQRVTPVPPVEPEPEPSYIALHYTQDLPHSITHLKFSFPDYYNYADRIVLEKTLDLEKVPFEARIYPDYYNHADRHVLEYTPDLDHHLIEIQDHPEYYDLASRYLTLRRTSDVPHEIILVREWPDYRAYEEQTLIETFDDEEPIYEEVYEPVLPYLPYTHDVESIVFIPTAPLTPPPPPPAPFVEDLIFIAEPAVVIPEPPVPAERHYDEIYVGQDALDVSVTPEFGQTNDHKKNLGLEKSVHDRVRDMEQQMRGDEGARRAEQERREKLERIQEEIRIAREQEMAALELEQHSYDAYAETPSTPSSPCKIKCDKRKKPNRKNTPAPLPQPIHVPDVFVMPERPVTPEKPKRVWQPPPKAEEEFSEYEEKPLGPVIFHELIYQQGILRQKFHEDHQNATIRPVAHPVSRATSRPNTPGLEVKSIDFPRLEGGISPRSFVEGEDNVDYVHDRIKRYDAYGASSQDSHTHSEKHSNTVVVGQVHVHQQVQEVQSPVHSHHEAHGHQHHVTSHQEAHGHVDHHTNHQVEHIVDSNGEHHIHHHHHHHHHHHDQKNVQVQVQKRESVVYDEPARTEIVYDVPHDQNHHHHHSQHHHSTISHDDSQYHQAIRHMSKSNKWSETDLPVVVPVPKRAHVEAHVKVSSESTQVTHVTSSTHHTVLHHSNSLNRQNIPPPLHIENSNSTSHHDHHVHYDDEDSENYREIHSSKSMEQYTPVNVGHVKNLAKIFNKPDEKPITTEQVIYRVRAAPPGHHLQQEIKPRPRSLPRIPMDEVELHEHGAKDHMTRSHHEHVEHHDFNGNPNQGQGHLIGSGAEVKVQVHSHSHTHTQGTRITDKSPTHHHNSHFYQQTEEPTIRVRRVYKALEDTSMLSPISMTGDENMYDVPAH